MTCRPMYATICLAWAVTATAGAVEKDAKAIDEVARGVRSTAKASWWGYDEKEATAALQAAIRSGAKKLIVDRMPGPWIVDKLELASDQEIEFEPGVEVLAKKDAFQGKVDSLFNGRGVKNVRLSGAGATLRMRRSDYAAAPYSKAEWRHVLNFHGCENVTIEGLTLAESGGDGIYLGTGRGGETNRNFVIRKVVCDANYRQGISIITAENLLIEDCVLKNTAGTAPAAGIDFEPNHPREKLVNCVMRNCVIENNQGYAIHVYARQFDATTAPISLRMENCVTQGTNAKSLSLITSAGEKGAVRGTIDVVNCRFLDAGKAGITIGSNATSGVRIRFEGGELADSTGQSAMKAAISIEARGDDIEDVGNIEFDRFLIKQPAGQLVMRFDDRAGVNVTKVSGSVIVEQDGKRRDITLDQATLGQWFPVDPINGLKRVALDASRLQASGAAAESRLPAFRLRDSATYLIEAPAGATVTGEIKHQRVGRSEGSPARCAILDPAGKTVAKLSVPPEVQQEFSFKATAAGFYRLQCEPKHFTVRVVRCSQPVSIAGGQRAIHLLAPIGDLYLRVPADAKELGIRFAGEGDAERVKAAVFDPSGKLVWEEAAVIGSRSYYVEPNRRPAPGVWRIHLDKPTTGVLEDVHVEIRGVPPLLGFSAATLPAAVMK